MSYAARATRFLAEREGARFGAPSPCEISEISEESPLPLDGGDAAALDAPDGDLAAAAADDGWTARMRAASAPIRHLPPAGCIGPLACSRLGPCERHARGAPCAEMAEGAAS